MVEGAAMADRRGFPTFLLALAALAAVWLGRATTGEVFVSTEVVARDVQPWSGLEPAPPPLHNENLADPPTVWLPMQHSTRERVREWLFDGGEPPLWGPESFCGAPWLGNMSSALFSPFTWLFVVLPFEAAFAVCAAAKWLLAGIGAWLLARKLGIGPAGRALAGLVFAFCGFQVVWVSSCLTNVSVLAPWLLLAIERVLERPGPGRTAGLALVCWQVLVGGHPETSFWVALGAVAYATVRWWGSAAPRGRSVVALASGAAIGALLAVAQWWPFLEYALQSYGRELRKLAPDRFRAVVEPKSWQGLAWCAAAAAAAVGGVALLRRETPRRLQVVLAIVAFVGAGVALRVTGLRPSLVLQLLPDRYGRSLDGGAYAGPLTYNDVTAGFCGATVFVLALATALLGRDRRVTAVALATLLAGARVFRVPLLSDLLAATPTLEQLGSTRALAFVALGAALLAAIGLERMATAPGALARAAVAALAFVGGVLVPAESIAQPWREDTTFGGDGHFQLGADPAPDLLDGGDGGLGATLAGSVHSDVVAVTIHHNDREIGRVAPGPPPPGKKQQTWSWRWLGSTRIEEGLEHVVVEAHHPEGSRVRACDWWIDTTRPWRPTARWAVHVAAALGPLALLLLRGVSSRAKALALLLITVVELAFFGARYNATTPRERMPAPVDPIPLLAQQRREAGPFRVFTARTHLHPNLHLLFDVDVVRGYDALEPLDFVRVLNEAYRGHEVPWVEMDFSTVDLEGGRGGVIADVANVRYVLSEEDPPTGFREVWRQQPATERRPLRLYENEGWMPRAFTVQRGLLLSEFLARGADDPRACAIWDEGEAATFAGAARVVALDHRRGRIRAAVESDAGTILVVSENFLPSGEASGWRATIDGEPATPRRTHGTFLSVIVPGGGRHEVELRYLPVSVTRGTLASAAGAGVLLLLALLALRRPRSP